MLQLKQKVCSRGHKYKGSGSCPVCWPGGVVKKYTKYHNDGTLWAKGFTRGGKMHGKWVWFRKDGTKMRTGNFTKGEHTGRWTTFDKNGRVVKITNLGKK